jgi:hypothetical protein
VAGFWILAAARFAADGASPRCGSIETRAALPKET